MVGTWLEHGWNMVGKRLEHCCGGTWLEQAWNKAGVWLEQAIWLENDEYIQQPNLKYSSVMTLNTPYSLPCYGRKAIRNESHPARLLDMAGMN